MALFDTKLSARLAKTLTAMCVRNTELEDIHAGIAPVSHTGDFSDVTIIDADGNEFTWKDAARVSDPEMKMLMKGVVNRLYTFFVQCDDPRFDRVIDYHAKFTHCWDEPEIDPSVDCANLLSEQDT